MIPLEIEEQSAFVKWLEMKKIKFTSIPNSTFTKSWNQKQKNKKEGLRAGFPDLVALVPCKDGNTRFVAIEMKRVKNSKVSKEQKEWIEAIDACPECGAYVCYGADEAVKTIEGIMNFNY